ncbi:MAG: hypothetical protein OXC44_07255 [Proteobacteria bacterium]|nr:hypothetical protein [Pseudomonadota bacterium]
MNTQASNQHPHYSPDYKPDYGERFETAIIVAMSALIVLSFIGVGFLWYHYAPACKVMEYTYCPQEHTAPAQDHH